MVSKLTDGFLTGSRSWVRESTIRVALETANWRPVEMLAIGTVDKMIG